MTAPTYQLIEGTITKKSQSVELTYLERLGDFKVKVFIKSDHYGENCRAYTMVWSPVELKWNEVASIPYSEMETDTGLCYNREWNDERHFQDDFDKLLKLTKEILL